MNSGFSRLQRIELTGLPAYPKKTFGKFHFFITKSEAFTPAITYRINKRINNTRFRGIVGSPPFLVEKAAPCRSILQSEKILREAD